MPDTTPARPIRVLFVDDEEPLRLVMEPALQQHGYFVETAEDGMDAWQKLTAAGAQYDVIITDNQMPRMSGVELIEKLRSIGFAGAIVVFASTLTFTTRQRLAALHVNSIVEKGRPFDELISALTRARSWLGT